MTLDDIKALTAPQVADLAGLGLEKDDGPGPAFLLTVRDAYLAHAAGDPDAPATLEEIARPDTLTVMPVANHLRWEIFAGLHLWAENDLLDGRAYGWEDITDAATDALAAIALKLLHALADAEEGQDDGQATD